MKEILAQLVFLMAAPVLMCFGHWTSQGTGLMSIDVAEKGNCIEITGQTGESGAVIARVTARRHQHDMIIQLHMIACGIPHPLARKSARGQGVQVNGLDHYQVPIGPGIERVLMGRKRVVVWQRGKGPIAEPAP